jgi:hypothetical protein
LCVYREGKKMLQIFQQKMERRILQVVWSDRQTDEISNKKEYLNKGTRGSGSQFEVGTGRPCGKNGPVQVDRRSVSVGPKNRWEVNGTTEDLLGRHVLESNRRTVVTNRQKPVRIA